MEGDQEEGQDFGEQQKALRQRVDWLFSRYLSRDLPDELRDIADYFSFLSRRISPDDLRVRVEPDLLERFEPVFLLLLDKLSLYPETIRAQVEGIVDKMDVCGLVAIAGVMQDSEPRTPLRRLWRSLLQTIASVEFGVKVRLTDRTIVRVTPQTLLNLKISLRRLAGIVRYASSIEFVEYDDDYRQFKQNYDPDLIDRSKLLALVNILKTQLNSQTHSPEKELLLGRLTDIETELRRKKVRWGVVMTAFFVMFGFLADLKTLNPNVYAEPCSVVERILATLHSDGLVSGKPQQLLAKNEREKGSSEEEPEGRNGPREPQAVLPERSSIRNDHAEPPAREDG